MHLDAKEIEALLSSVPSHTLQHLLSCARCRRRMATVLADLDQPDDEFVVDPANPGQESLSLPPTTFETFILRAIELSELEGQRPPTPPEALLSARDLLAIRPEGQLEAVATHIRFRDLAVAGILLDTARDTAADDPLQSKQLAIVATAILDNFDPTTKRDRLQAEAACLLAEAQRRMGNLDIAEDFFREAAFDLRDQPLLLGTRALLSRLWAALRQEQGRVDEALGLLEHASIVAEELGDYRELALSRLAHGWLLLDEFDPEGALLALREALPHLDPRNDTRSLFSTLHALALAYAELADENQLATTLSMLDELAPDLDEPLDPVRIRWVKARASWRLHEYDRATAELREIFETLAGSGMGGPETALAGLELARMLSERDPQPEDLPESLAWISARLESLPAEQLPFHLLPVLRFALRFPARREGAFLDVLLSAYSYIERARFNPDYPFYPTPLPELTMGWTDLTSAQRRKAAQAANIELDFSGQPTSLEDHLVIAWTHEALTGVRIQVPLAEDRGQG